MPEGKVTVGVVGVGLMGTACAKRLLGAGFDVLGYDVDREKLAGLNRLGGRSADSLAEVARACPVIMMAVFNTDQVEAIIEGPEGLLASQSVIGTPITVACVSTCDPDRIAALAARLPGDRLRYVEFPISGTSDQTARGEGLGLIGGDRAAAEEAGDVLGAICPRRHYLGAAGNGGRAKLAINLILGINRAALAEGLVFAERMGLDPQQFLDVARASAAYSQIMDVKGAKMIAGDFSPHGKLMQTRKDFTLMQEQADRLGQELPLARTYLEIVDAGLAKGEGDLDNCAVIKEIRRRSSLPETAPGRLLNGREHQESK